jgi:CRISPR/Cas system-associated protein Csm6
VLLTRSRGIVDDVLMIIARNPKFMKSYQVKRNLVENPKCPIQLAVKLVLHLREADLRLIAKSKNISSAVQSQARRHLQRRKT